MHPELEKLANYLRQAHYPAYMELVKLAFVNEQYMILFESKIFENLIKKLEVDGPEWMNEFMDLNSMVFVEYPVTKVLGSGGYGTAYELEDGRVMKIFNNLELLDHYRQKVDELHSGRADKSSAMIYDTGIFQTPHDPSGRYSAVEAGRTLAWVVMEMLDVPAEGDPRHQLLDQVSTFIFDYDFDQMMQAGDDQHDMEAASGLQYGNLDVLLEFVKEKLYKKYGGKTGYLKAVEKAGLTPEDVVKYITFIFNKVTSNPMESDYGAENMGYRPNTGGPVAFDFYMGGGEPSDEARQEYFRKMDYQYEDED